MMAFIITGCQSAKIVSTSKLKLKQDFCVSPSTGDYSGLPAIVQNLDSLFEQAAKLQPFLSKQGILTANASGTMQLIINLVELGRDSPIIAERLFLAYTIEIQKNISLVKSEIDAVSSELQCESFRTRQLSAYLGNLNAKINSRLTVGAIAVGSLTTILPVLLTGKISTYVVGIGGGLLSAGLGIATLKTSRYTLKMVTDRNLLENIWNGDSSKLIYPPQLWYYLNEPGFGNSPQKSIVQVLKMRWLKFDLNNSLDNTTAKLLFGNGGIFNQDNLDLRATMLTELAAEVNSMTQYLDNLNYKINTIKLQVLLVADIHAVSGT
ncbi:MAG: hypothetical protein ABI472_18935 [Ginsengibacter sp.]